MWTKAHVGPPLYPAMPLRLAPQLDPVARTRWFGTLKVRLMVASALVIAASVSVSVLVVLQHLEKRSEQAVMDLERDNVERVASLLVQRVVDMQKMLRATAAIMPEAARHDPAAAATFLVANPALQVHFASVFVADTAGRLLAIHDGNTVTQPAVDLADRDYFKQTLSGAIPVVSAPFTSRVSNQPAITLTMPVMDGHTKVAAVLAGTLRLASRNLFDDLTYAGSSGGDSIATIITDGHGQIISHPLRDRILRPIESEPGLASVVAQWTAQGRPVEPTGLASHTEGRFVAMAGVPGADWMVFRVAPDQQLLGGVVQARREAMQWATGVALLGSLLILGLLALLLNPLSRLRKRALALQDSQRPINEGWPRVGGEIGQLSQVLQQVLAQRAQDEQAKHVLVQQMGSVLAAAPIGIAFTRHRRFELAGAEFSALMGWAGNDLVGREAREIYASENEYEALGSQVGAAFAAGRPYIGELQFRRRDGSTFWGRLQGRPVDAADAAAGTIWLLEDVTERREARERLSWTASHDALTRLLNRASFEERLGNWLQHPRQGRCAALLFIDLDHFKAVNDNAGHAAGDGVLRQVAAMLHLHVRAGDTAARLGGDEFAVLLPGCVAAVALQLAERLRQAIMLIGVDHQGRRLCVGASIGVVEIDPALRAAPEAWMARVDAACYAAKHAGRGNVRLGLPPPHNVPETLPCIALNIAPGIAPDIELDIELDMPLNTASEAVA